MTSCERMAITWPFVALVTALAMLGSSSSAIMRRSGFELTALIARTVETTLASPEASASRIMIDFAPETFTRFRSAGFVGSPVRVMTFIFPIAPTRDSMSFSIASLASVEKMTTLGLRTFALAIASSFSMGKSRLDQPRISVCPDSMTGPLPNFN